MFNSIGGKIKAWSEIICWGGIFLSLFSGITLHSVFNCLGISRGSRNGGALFIIIIFVALGILTSWVGSFLLYGFGQLVENSDVLVGQIQNQKNQEAVENAKINMANDNIDDNVYIDIYCPYCGEKLSYSKKIMKNNKMLTCPFCSSSFQTLS